MKKFLSIFVAFIALFACNSVDEVSDDLTVCSEDIQTQISRSTDTEGSINYPFINLMVGENFGGFVPRRTFLMRDGLYLLSRNATEQRKDLIRLHSLCNRADVRSFEEEKDQKLLDLYGAEQLIMIRKALKAHFYGNIEELEAIPLSASAQTHINRTLKFLDDVAKPFGDYALKSSFGSATTEEECDEAAIEELIDLGIGYTIGIITGFSTAATIFTAYQLYKIYKEHSDCVDRVNSNPS